MNYSELKEKYYTLENEYEQLEINARLFENPLEKKLKEHPYSNTGWINYARDQKFNFCNLKLPHEEDDDMFKSIFDNINIHELTELMTINKDFIICKNCGTRWTLDIQLNGTYEIYDECGVVITNFESDGPLSAYGLPRRIKTVKDLMYIIDVIKCNSHESNNDN